MVDTKNPRYLLKFWLPIPNKFLVGRYVNFVHDAMQLFNPQGDSKEIEDRAEKLYLLGMVNLYKQLFYGLVYLDEKKDSKKVNYCRQVFFDEFGEYPDTPEHIEMLIAEYGMYSKKLNEVLDLEKANKEKAENTEQNDSYSFRDEVAAVSNFLNIPIDYRLKLYEFQSYYKLALQNATKLKQHGGENN